MTDSGSNHGAQPAVPPDRDKRRPRSERFWSWLRVVVLLLAAIGLGAWGSQLRPSAAKPISVSLPKITVLADKPNATATVDMTLSSNLRETPPYSLTLTITPANASQSVKFAVSFGHFPRPASGNQLGNQPHWTPPLLEAGTTTFSSPDPALGDYQYLAGDNPTLLSGNRWMWSGINGVTMLASSVQAQDNEQNDLFYAGLLLGVAAGAGIMCITEFLRPAWRKGTDKPAAN